MNDILTIDTDHKVSQTRGHWYAPCAQTAGVIFNKIKAGIIKGSHSDFLIRTKPRSNLISMMGPRRINRREKIFPALKGYRRAFMYAQNQFFSCEAQLNTCTCPSVCLSVCPSVRPWSKLNFSLFGQLKTAYDSL